MLKYFVVFLFVVFSNVCFCNTNDLIEHTIKHFEFDVDDEEATLIADSVRRYSTRYRLDWKMMLAIIAQESKFKKDPQDCLHNKKLCNDLGIAQINYPTWGKTMGLSRVKLLKDIDYNIGVMSQILFNLKKVYGKEKKWHTRYHSFTQFYRQQYGQKIYFNYSLVDAYAKGYGE